MLELALRYAAAGWHVFPLKPRAKSPITQNGFKDATTDVEQIKAWWAKTPDANIGIACGASGLCVLDADHGLKDGNEFNVWRERNGLAGTYTVRSGRAEFGVHMYFKGAVPDGKFELDGVTGEIKSLGGYVVAAGSTHPSGNEYREVVKVPLAHTPAIVEQSRKRASEGTADDGLPVTESRNIRMASIVGKLRHQFKAGQDVILEMAERINEDRFQPPLDDAELAKIVANSFKLYPTPEETPEVIIGGKKIKTAAAAVEVDTSEDEEELEHSGRPEYPDEVWAGTFYGEFADLCGERNFVPKKFFIEALRTVIGAIVGERLTCDIDGANARAFTILITEPGGGKGTACDRVMQLFGEHWEGLRTSQEQPLLFGPKDFAWRTRGIGAQIVNPASAPGLMMALEPRKRKKDEEPNPQEMWKPLPRVITIMEEARGLFANFANESTGSGLESVICELYDRISFSTTATKDRQPIAGRLMYSLLGGITKEGWDSVFGKLESVESGFLTRVNIIGSEEPRRVSDLIAPDFGPLRTRLLPYIQALIDNPRRITASPAARALVSKWFANLVMPDGLSRSRLNIHAWRCALHLAWLRGHNHITEEDADAGTRIADYQALMREYYAPPEGETRQARCEAAIRKVLRARRRVTVNELRKLTNYRRVGIGTWDKSLKALEQGGELRVEDKANASGRAVRRVVLLKQHE